MHILFVNTLYSSVLRTPRTTGPLSALIGFDQMKSYRKPELLQLNLVKLQEQPGKYKTRVGSRVSHSDVLLESETVRVELGPEVHEMARLFECNPINLGNLS